MENMKVERKKNKLHIEIDLSKELGPSSSGKTIIVASSRGNAPVPDTMDYFIGLNLFKYADGGKKSKKS